MPTIRFSPRAYVGSVIQDARASLGRVVHDRFALAVMILVLLPWLSQFFLQSGLGWLTSLGEIAGFVFLFWWMSRSASGAQGSVRQPAAEALLATALVVLWDAWRTGICTKQMFFLPANLNCFDSWEFEVIPKLIVCVIFPFVVLRWDRYGYRAQGVGLSLRPFWVALPALAGCAVLGFYLHAGKPLQFIEGTGNFFFGAGLPEEYLFRAFLLTRFEAWFKKPALALFGSSLVFGLAHLPIDYLVFTPSNWRETWITLLTYQMGFGAAFAFAYQRVRNIWPVAVLHAMVDAL